MNQVGNLKWWGGSQYLVVSEDETSCLILPVVSGFLIEWEENEVRAWVRDTVAGDTSLTEAEEWL